MVIENILIKKLKFNYLIIRQLLNNFFKLNNYQRLNLKLKQIEKEFL